MKVEDYFKDMGVVCGDGCKVCRLEPNRSAVERVWLSGRFVWLLVAITCVVGYIGLTELVYYLVGTL